MKKVFVTIACFSLFFFVSCKDSTTSSGSMDNTSQAEKNRENTKAVFKGIETGDMSAMDNFVAKDVVDHGGGTMGDIKGLDSVKKALGDIHNHISNLKMDLIADATDGDYEFSLIRMTGTTKDGMMGMPPNTPMDEMSVGVVKIVNGKSTEHWQYVDPKDMMKMMQNMKMDTTKMGH